MVREELQQELANLTNTMATLRVGAKGKNQVTTAAETYLSLLEDTKREGHQ
jgi:hypothetical protein